MNVIHNKSEVAMRSVRSSRSSSPAVETNQAYDDESKIASDMPVSEKEHHHLDENNNNPTSFEYEYLTFDTILPDFALLSYDASTPQPPDIKKYDSPFGWSDTRKNICLALSCVATFIAAYSAGMYSFAAEPLRAKWNISETAFLTGVTTWCVGFAISPMFLAPFSEINGRQPVFLASGLLFLVASIGCAVTDSFAGMLVARFFVGAGASTFSTMIGGVISDVYHAENRNTPMAIYSSFALGGTGIGPMCGGFIIDHTSWEWIFWSHAIALGVFMVAAAIYFKETRGSVLLSRKAKVVNKYLDELDEFAKQFSPDTPLPSQNRRYKVAADEQRATITRMIYLSTTTPFKFLFTEPVVFFFSLWAAFAWGVLYMCFDVIPLIYQTRHNFTTPQVAAIFASIAIGTTLGAILSIAQESLLFKKYPHLRHKPENRLYSPCIYAALLPIGLFWFGWTTSSRIHWIVPTIAIAAASLAIYTVYLAVFNYLADVYHRYASSALACQSFCRNMLAAVFPLFTNQMFRGLGYPGAASLLGGIGVVLTLVPWVLVWKGEEIRGRSRVASEIVRGKQ